MLEAVLSNPLVHYGAWFGGAGLGAWLGARQGRNPLTCFVAGVVVTPLLALPVLLWLGPLRPDGAEPEEQAPDRDRSEPPA